MTGLRPAAWIALAVAAAAPWAFGASDPSWAALVAVGCLVPGAIALIADAIRPPRSVSPRTASYAICAVLAAALVGLVPLPHAVRALLAPAGTELLSSAAPDDVGWRPTSLAPHATVAGVAFAAAYVLAFLLIAAEARRTGGRRLVTTLLTLSGVGLAVIGVLQFVSQRGEPQPRIYWTFRVAEAGTPFGPYVNRNLFAGAMAVLASIAAGECLAAWSEARRAIGAAYGAAALLMIGALAMTTSRGGALGAVAAACFLVACAPSRRRIRGALLVGAGLVAVVGLLAWLGVLQAFLARIPQSDGRALNRFGVQGDALRAFLGNPVTGTGAGTFDSVYPAFQRVCDDRSFSNAHSDWAQILMETGLFGLVAAVLVVREVVRWVRIGLGMEGATRWRVLGPAAGAFAIAVHGFFDVNLHVPANALLTVCALSLASAAAAEPARVPPAGSAPEPGADGTAPTPHP